MSSLVGVAAGWCSRSRAGAIPLYQGGAAAGGLLHDECVEVVVEAWVEVVAEVAVAEAPQLLHWPEAGAARDASRGAVGRSCSSVIGFHQ